MSNEIRNLNVNCRGQANGARPIAKGRFYNNQLSAISSQETELKAVSGQRSAKKDKGRSHPLWNPHKRVSFADFHMARKSGASTDNVK